MTTERALVLSLSERISAARTCAGLSRGDITKRCRISQAAVSGWENGSVKDLRNKHLFALADATGCSARWIATGKGGPRDTSEFGELTELYSRCSDANRRKMLRLAREIAYLDNLERKVFKQGVSTKS